MKLPIRILGAIYDVDDTILDNHPNKDDQYGNFHEVARLAATKSLASRGGAYESLLAITPAENREVFVTAQVATLRGGIRNQLVRREILTSDAPLDHPDITAIVELKDSLYEKLLHEHGRPVLGADGFIRDLANRYGLQSAIASSARREDIVAFLEAFDLLDVFPENHIIDIECVTHPKPDPEPFEKAFQSFGLADDDRSRVVAFEDDPRGLMSARNAGLYVCAITTRHSVDELRDCAAKPDFVATSYDELRQHFGLSA